MSDRARELRVAVVTQDDPFYVPLFFETFFPALPDGVTVVSVTILPSFDESFPALVRRMYRLYGPVNFLRRGVEFVYRTVIDALLGGYSVASVARRHGISVDHRESVNTDPFLDELDRLDVDVLLSVSAPEIFEADVLATPNWGCLNVHTANLPEYRGMLPTFWALYHGETEIGVTVHTMVEEVDRGKIIRQTAFPVADSDSLDDAIKRGKRTGGRLAAAALGDIENGSVTLTPMNGEGSYFSFPTIEERREFQRRGGRLL